METTEAQLRGPPRVALLVETSSIYGRRVLQGLTRHLRSHRPWSVILEQRDLRTGLPTWLRGWNGHGIISRATTPELLDLVESAGIALVDLTDRHGVHRRSPQIWADNVAIAGAAADHLLDRGFTRFASCGFTSERWSDERVTAFVSRVASRGYPCTRFDSPWLGFAPAATSSWEDQQARLAAWLREQPRPLGVFACNDLRGQQVIEACARAGLGVPEDVATVGVDDDEVVCALCDPPLTSVVPDAEALGRTAGALLDAMMDGESVECDLRRVPPVGIATRQSTDILAIGDPGLATAVRFIREHACSGVTVEAVLAHVPMSRSAIERRFRKHFGRSPQAVIRDAQLKEVKRLLRETEHKLQRVAELTGFKHTEHMCVVFKRETGQTPGQFRAAR